MSKIKDFKFNYASKDQQQSFNKIIRRCEKGEGAECYNWATHVLFYVKPSTMQNIWEYPKFLCRFHIDIIRLKSTVQMGVLHRYMTVDQYVHLLQKKEERKNKK